MITGVATDDLPAIGAALADLIVASQPKRRVGALAAATGEEDLGETLRQPTLDQTIVQEQALLGVGHIGTDVARLEHRRVGGIGDLGTAPADVADNGPAGTVENATTIGREEPAALSADDGRLVAGVGDEVISGVVHRVSLSLQIGQVVAEHDRQPRTGGGDLGNTMLPIVLARAAHHEQIAMTQLPRA